MRLGVSALLLLWLPLSGCERIARTKQCKNLVSTVNSALDEIAARQDAGVSAAGEREMAGRYERLAAELLALKLENEALAKTVAEYAVMVKDTARLLRRIADSRERNEAIVIAVSKRELANQARREKMIVTRIDAACQSP
jgi:hypothetical protein